MSTKIVLVADNHGLILPLKRILLKHPAADYYWHLGDSELELDELRPFMTVRGNNDYDFRFPKEKLLEVEALRILLVHGQHEVSFFSDKLLIAKAQQFAADLTLFGHTHRYADFTVGNCRFLNPGSCAYPRDGLPPSYVLLTLDEKSITAERKFLK